MKFNLKFGILHPTPRSIENFFSGIDGPMEQYGSWWGGLFYLDNDNSATLPCWMVCMGHHVSHIKDANQIIWMSTEGEGILKMLFQPEQLPELK